MVLGGAIGVDWPSAEAALRVAVNAIRDTATAAMYFIFVFSTYFRMKADYSREFLGSALSPRKSDLRVVVMPKAHAGTRGK
jgi:hypothetical protein